MKKVVVGYGEYNAYSIDEIPNDFLETLCKRFPLDVEHCWTQKTEDLRITIAVHQEAARRKAGGHTRPHIPTTSQLARQLIKHGFRNLSKTHHPDVNGQVEAQKRLVDARDQLEQFCQKIKEPTDPKCLY
ncbi:MAG: hypothetical protein ABL967_12165, partial [Bryobacteraceae bacterium]